MIPPAQMPAIEWNVVDRMIDIGRPHAQRIEGKADRGGGAQARDHQPGRASQLGDTGQRDHLFGPGHPTRRDCHESAGRAQMGNSRDQIGQRQHPARDPAPDRPLGRPCILRCLAGSPAVDHDRSCRRPSSGARPAMRLRLTQVQRARREPFHRHPSYRARQGVGRATGITIYPLPPKLP